MNRTTLLLAATLLGILLASGVAWANTQQYGTAGPDVLTGTPERDKLFGQGGSDVLKGREGADFLRGDASEESRTNGTDGDDRLIGGSGKDILGGAYGGDDLFFGGDNPDDIAANESIRPSRPTSNPGVDEAFGGGANDRIDSVDGFRDVIDCGPGSGDYLLYDRGIDEFKNCEDLRPYTIG